MFSFIPERYIFEHFLKKIFIFCCFPDGDIFTLVVSENSTLLIYQNTTLKWSAKIHFPPVCIRRIFLKSVQGAIALLSEEGRLECCYLGTEPSLSITPPLAMRQMDLEKVEQELDSLNKVLKSFHEHEGETEY